jgi:hypothetical protein
MLFGLVYLQSVTSTFPGEVDRLQMADEKAVTALATSVPMAKSLVF